MAAKKRSKSPRPQVRDEWSDLGASADRARSVSAQLRDFQKIDHASGADIKKAREYLSSGKPIHAKDCVRAVYVNLGQAQVEACKFVARVDALRQEPLLVDESSAQTRAHRLADAFDREVIRLSEIRVASSRALTGSAEQVAAALSEVERFWSTPDPCGCAPQASQALTLVGDTKIGEPILAVAEGGAVYGCGACPESALTVDRITPPAIIQFERATFGADGGRLVVQEAVPVDVADDWINGRVCVPWVRVERDPEKFRECMAASAEIGPVKNAKAVFRLLKNWFAKQDQEAFVTIMLDAQGKMRAMSEIARGARDHAEVPVPDVLRIALFEGASSVIVAHNHPSGVVDPSESDKKFTKELQRAFGHVHVTLIDHVIIGHSKFYSFAEHGLI